MKKIFTILALLALCTSAFSQNVALPFSVIRQDPAAAAMGGTYLASVGRHGFEANPALAPFSSGKGDLWQPSSANYVNLDGSMCFKQRFSLGLGFSYGIGAAYESISSIESIPEKFNPKDLMIGAGFGMRFGKYLGAGVKLRYIGQTLSPDSKLGTVRRQDKRLRRNPRSGESGRKGCSGQECNHKIPNSVFDCPRPGLEPLLCRVPQS